MPASGIILVLPAENKISAGSFLISHKADIACSFRYSRKETVNNKTEVTAMSKLLIFRKAMQTNRGIKLLNIPDPIVARTEMAPPFTA